VRYQAALRPACVPILGAFPETTECLLRRKGPTLYVSVVDHPHRGASLRNLPTIVLGVSLALIPVMLFLALHTPQGSQAAARVTVGRFATTTSCPAAEEERCYGAPVTNTGESPTGVDCTLTDVGGAPAVFFNGTTRYMSGGTIPAGGSITLLIKLAPSIEASPALPQLTCVPI
jgi:hypothetical protein